MIPNGLVITTEWTKTEFENSLYFRGARPYDHGTLPFQWFRLAAGLLEGHELWIQLCFYKDVLASFHASVNFYPTNAAGWENFSLEIESQSKAFHDRLLQNQLGKPHQRISSPTSEDHPILDTSIEYHYKWGTVWSGYDSRGGSSSIVIQYGSRLEDAQKDYRAKSQG